MNLIVVLFFSEYYEPLQLLSCCVGHTSVCTLVMLLHTRLSGVLPHAFIRTSCRMEYRNRVLAFGLKACRNISSFQQLDKHGIML